MSGFKVGDKVRVNCPGRVTNRKKCVITEAANGEYTVKHLNLISKNLKAEHLEPVVAAPQSDRNSDANKKVNLEETPNSSIPDPGPG